jgi:glycosyltransferase involved in cell wall biosynthesis
VRILHVHTRYRQPGGEDTVVAAERRLLANAGHEVVPVDLENPASPLASATALTLAPWNLAAARGVASAAAEIRPDLAHVHNTWFALGPAVFGELHRMGVPTVATFHNYRLVCVNAMLYRDGGPCETCVGRSPWPGVRHACYRDSRVASAAVAATIATHRRAGTWSHRLGVGIALTKFARERLLAGGLVAERTLVVPNFTSDPGERSLNAAASDEVLFVGRLSEEKGVALLVEAWMAEAPRGLRLTIVGDGPDGGRLRERAGTSVEFTGRLDGEEVQRRMLRSRALVFPSTWYEGQPMVLLEALAAGLPVLYTDLGAIGETVGSGGWGFPSTGSPGLAKALQVLADDLEVEHASARARGEFLARFHPTVGLENRLVAYATALE